MSWIEHLRSANWNQASGAAFSAYLLGCFTSGYYLVRWMARQDIRAIGSGSVGARNVGRVLGKTGFLLTVLCDFSKGILAVWATRHFTADDRIILLSMLAVVAGHIWPAQLRFQGGKGMATSLGSLLIYDVRLAMTFAVIFLCSLACVRRTVLPALFALACIPIAASVTDRTPSHITLLSVWAGLVLFAHRRNLMDEFSQLTERRDEQPEPHQPQL